MKVAKIEVCHRGTGQGRGWIFVPRCRTHGFHKPADRLLEMQIDVQHTPIFSLLVGLFHDSTIFSILRTRCWFLGLAIQLFTLDQAIGGPIFSCAFPPADRHAESLVPSVFTLLNSQ
jgi:hypothetical protein